MVPASTATDQADRRPNTGLVWHVEPRRPAIAHDVALGRRRSDEPVVNRMVTLFKDGRHGDRLFVIAVCCRLIRSKDRCRRASL